MKVTHPNGSVETWSEYPKMMLYVEAPSQFGRTWGMPMKHGVHNQRTGNPDAAGIFRRGRKWYLDFVHGEGWVWR